MNGIEERDRIGGESYLPAAVLLAIQVLQGFSPLNAGEIRLREVTLGKGCCPSYDPVFGEILGITG